MPGANFMALAAAATGSGMTFSFVTSATANDTTITIPVTSQAGDIAVLLDVTNTDGSPSGGAPSGWTVPTGASDDVTYDTTFSHKAIASYKKLAGGEPGSVITGMDGDTEWKTMLVFRPSTSVTTITASTWNSEAAEGNPSAQTVSASGQTAPLIVFGCSASADGTAAFTTESPAFDSTVANGIGTKFGYKIYNASPSDHSIDMGDVGAANILMSGYLRFA